ncbi:hypothetical protein DMH12_17200 [Streptomyces sp. WAC 04229]|uniref:hypothetical protein n=1 Tax=Streptomyces sp. WAC 04229 TaxID=2203206 RepID=UPI000F7411DF|nr:hypothetical protein [Streptomyces sp. WAC 04229]RSN53993.1 hypothetical protein DMH12_17200 [Streptomyces sp. WAC 04229]
MLAAFLRTDPELSGPVREALSGRMGRLPAKEEAFSPTEFEHIRGTARRMVRAAHLRIVHNLDLLETWRSGAHREGSMQWLVGETLEALAHTGYCPPWPVSRPGLVPHRYAKALGGAGAEATWKRLFLGREEVAAVAVLLAAEFGWNASVISQLQVPRLVSAVPQAGAGAVYRLELHKMRRGARSMESRNLTDWGADSPGRLITTVLQCTAPARRLVEEGGGDAGRLLIWREATDSRRRAQWSELRTGPFALGLTGNQVESWGRAHGLSGSPLRRLRRTVNVLHRREPGQNSQDVHDTVYVLREPQARQAAVPVIAAGVTEALEAARATVVRARLTAAHRAGDQPTVLADCADFAHSPLMPGTEGCRASFLLCTACPNARVHPGHHPRLAYLQRAIDSLRPVLPAEVWEAEWRDPVLRLADLRARVGESSWLRARAAVTADERAVIDALMKGHLDP